MFKKIIKTIPSKFLQQQKYNYTSLWTQLKPLPLDGIKQLSMDFQKDTNPKKVLLGEGCYRDDDGKPVILNSVRKAEEKMFNSKLNHEYAPVSGVPEFCKAAREFAFGEDNEAVKSERIATVQAISGTGALKLAADFLKKFAPGKKVYLPNPTWLNHNAIFQSSDFELAQYRYFDQNTGGMNVSGCLEDVSKAPKGSIMVFHACAHNPTGVDPSIDTWKELSKVCLEREHIVFFDSAYQGFASGDPVRDAQSFRIFVKDGHNPIVTQSFSKNFGLYGERVGALNFVCGSKQTADIVTSNLMVIIRSAFSNPPIYGARIVSTVLSDKELKSEWESDVKMMADRIISMRSSLVKGLKDNGSTKDWSHITNQIGMFAYSGLTKDQVENIIQKHHVYLTRDGRISISGLNSKNIDYVSKAIHDVTK